MRTVQSLCVVCLRTVQSLCVVCLRTVQFLCVVCLRTVQSLCVVCLRTALSLFVCCRFVNRSGLCLQTDQSLFVVCLRTTQSLFFDCLRSVQSLFVCCLSVYSSGLCLLFVCAYFVLSLCEKSPPLPLPPLFPISSQVEQKEVITFPLLSVTLLSGAAKSTDKSIFYNFNPKQHPQARLFRMRDFLVNLLLRNFLLFVSTLRDIFWKVQKKNLTVKVEDLS